MWIMRVAEYIAFIGHTTATPSKREMQLFAQTMQSKIDRLRTCSSVNDFINARLVVVVVIYRILKRYRVCIRYSDSGNYLSIMKFMISISVYASLSMRVDSRLCEWKIIDTNFNGLLS